MVISIDLEVDGVTGVVRALQAIGVDVESPQQALSRLADEATGIVIGEIPVRSGRLAGTARATSTKDAVTVTVGDASTPYAGVINFGWAAHSIAPAGFMERTDERMQPIALRRLEEDINRAIRQQGLKT